MTKREKTPRSATTEGAYLDSFGRRADPNGNRDERRRAAKWAKRQEAKKN